MGNGFSRYIDDGEIAAISELRSNDRTSKSVLEGISPSSFEIKSANHFLTCMAQIGIEFITIKLNSIWGVKTPPHNNVPVYAPGNV